MKLHWGTGIAIFLSCFMAMILGFVINSFQHDSELVSEDYYAQEISYQERIEQRSNASDLDIQVDFNEQGIILSFPEGASAWEGTISFFRPSDKDMDFKVPLKLEETSSQSIARDLIKPGLWRLKFEWNQDGKSFYTEKSVVAP